ncbi:MAG TPA: vitamin K epoxide reductase family protein [Dermatophilaceae bacterium]|nr:vitamin K epoxide reductase family protein [Dermatophilaceae bacterium]
MSQRRPAPGKPSPTATTSESAKPAAKNTQAAKQSPRPRLRQRGVPGWLVPTALALCVVGLLVSAYLTYDTFSGGGNLACPEGETLNCAKVTQSPWSKVFGIPVAPLGLLFFVVMTWLCRRPLFLAPGTTYDRLRLAWVGLGLAFVAYLVWAELFQIGAICLWCTVVHVAVFALFVVLLFGQILIEPAPERIRYKDRPR